MSDLIVFTYTSATKAELVLQEVVTLNQQHLVQIDDAAVIVKNEDNKVKVHQTLESAVRGGQVLSGGFWGLLIGFIFGGPLLGAAFGALLSALLGRNIDIGVDNQFIRSVGDELAPGNSALFLLIHDATMDKVTDALSVHGGTLYHTSLSKEAEEVFAKALEHEPLKEAVEKEMGIGITLDDISDHGADTPKAE